MLEKFSEEEIKTLVKELKEAGIKVSDNEKSVILRREAAAFFGGNPFISSDLSHAIYLIADFATDNYEKRVSKSGEGKSRTYVKKTVASNIENEYRRVINGIFELIKQHYGKMGFRDIPTI